MQIVEHEMYHINNVLALHHGNYTRSGSILLHLIRLYLLKCIITIGLFEAFK